HGEYKGKIYPVNPSGGEFLGHTVYRNLKEIPETVDLAFILLPPPKVAGAIAECGKIGIRTCVVITAGFQELGESGKVLEEGIVGAAKDADVAIVGPNCAGVSSPHPMSMHCMMQPAFPRPGNIAIISQSGNIAGSLQHMLSHMDIGVSRCVSVGNQAFLDTLDFLEYFIDDEQTKVVVAYIEGVSDGKRFMEVAGRLTKVKPLIVVKGGQSESGVKAAKSHTGAIAGSGSVFEGMCDQCGIVHVDDVEDMLDTAVAFLSQPIPKGNRIGIVANGGGWGVLTADACVRAGLDVVDLPDATLRLLDERLPAWWNRQNPVDLVAGMSRGAFFKAVDILGQCEVIDGLIVLGFGYSNSTANILKTIPNEEGLDYAQYVEEALYSDKRGMNFLLDVIKKHQKPALLASEYIVGADMARNEAILEFRRRNILIYPSSWKPAKIMARLVRYGRYLQETN
ncbi:MAG: hypothetical protein GY866_19755, partial [Proteobacteria bacterium]|nr:hypothetical protein [Pseudomonadota bacterium]